MQRAKMKKQIIKTVNAPSAIGPYNQAVKAGNTVYISGQIPLDHASGKLVDSSFSDQVNKVFDNLTAISVAADSDLNHAVKLTIYLSDLSKFSEVNSIMEARMNAPYPARVTIQAAKLPLDAEIEIDAILVIPN